jgi:hypothetical protein
MDVFTLVSVLIMGSATLCGFGLLVSLILMERNCAGSGSAGHRTKPCRNRRNRTRVPPRPAALHTGAASASAGQRRRDGGTRAAAETGAGSAGAKILPPPGRPCTTTTTVEGQRPGGRGRRKAGMGPVRRSGT